MSRNTLLELLIKRSRSVEPPEPSMPDDEVWYYAPSQVTLYSQTNVVSHTYSNGKGVIKYNAPLTTMPDTLRGTGITDVEMPDGVTSIGDNAFYGCTSLALTSLPSGITSIDNNVFRGCTNLALTSLPDGVTSIGDNAFYGCTSLALTSLPSGVTSIGDNAFNGCTSLALTSLPSGLTSIKSFAFSGCTNLALTSLPSGVTSIGDNAFYGCTSLALTSLPSGVTSIGYRAFYGCTSLALTSLPSGVTSIDNNVFRGCTNLALTSLPDGVTSIGDNAFNGCTSLASLTFKGTPTTISSSAFYNCDNLLDIYVPWAEGEVADAPWGATNATVHYSVLTSAVRFAAGVDTTLYITNTNGVFTAAPDGTWGGTGYHRHISGTWVSFYPKHGLKYSLDGGATYLDWCFEDTNSTLDLSGIGTSISSVTKISGRDSVSLSNQQIIVNDPSSGSTIYEFDVVMQ